MAVWVHDVVIKWCVITVMDHVLVYYFNILQIIKCRSMFQNQ